ncbi:urease accessory protein UreF [Enterococcus hirae]|nr:urease accessory protein UreF [Enterococcus hirae]THE13551.1 urease accessory protein UreF [Enterococcus hirae]
MDKMKLLQYLEVIQVCDSTFPIGTFNHSYGMETYLREDTINDSKAFAQWLKAYLDTQFRYGEGLLIKLCYENLPQNVDELWTYDKIITHSTQALETRKGTKMVAKQMIQLIQSLYSIELLDYYEKRINEGLSHGHPAIIFAIFTKELGLSVSESICFYGYSILSTMIQNAVRAIPLGQKDGQLILSQLFPELVDLSESINDLDRSYLGAMMPGIELAQIRHETQMFRLFMS